MQIGSEMATLQEKNPKMDPKKRFFSKIPQDFELLKQVPQYSHQTVHLGWNQYIGTLILSQSALPSGVLLWLQRTFCFHSLFCQNVCGRILKADDGDAWGCL